MENGRRPTRLPQFDYGSPGAYFITICTRGRACVLSGITVGAGLCARPDVTLTEIGAEVERAIVYINRAYPGVSVETYAIMPNHVHLLLLMEERPGGDGAPPLQQIIGRMKSYTTRRYGDKLWQRSYYDHVVRGEEDYLEIWRYIDENPAKWAEDRFYR